MSCYSVLFPREVGEICVIPAAAVSIPSFSAQSEIPNPWKFWFCILPCPKAYRFWYVATLPQALI